MKRMFVFCLFAGILLTGCQEKASVDITRLSCENLIDPQGIDCVAPRLGWEIQSDGRGVLQKSYRILVASSLEKLNVDEGDLWDSKEVKSDETVFILYSGKKLESRATCFWKVQVTTNKGKSGWSQPASWTMGLTESSDWKAQWTGLDKSFAGDVTEGKTRLSARYFRKEFDAAQQPVKATVYISGLGLYKLYINGKKTGGEQELAPTPTDYTRSVKYNTFDVTGEIVQGVNAIATTLGNGRYFSFRQPGARHFGFPKMILQLELTYADGTVQTVLSDNSWKVTADGPVRTNSEYDGEEYDARKELTGWNTAGFDDSAWQQAELVQAPGGKLEAQLNRNIKVMETIHPKGIKEIKPGTYILDMGQNMVGWVTMKVKGQTGKQVKLRFAEALKEDGNLYMDNLRGALVTDLYTLKGAETEIFEPSFIYHGFRYMEITGYPGVPQTSDFEGKVIYDDVETTGQFETSDATINQIYKNAYWGIRGNYRGMPTDCPQRDERMGWLGDRAVGSQGESFVFGINNLYAKWLDDIEQSQREDGSIPDVAPNYWEIYSDNMTWPGAYVIIANMLYEQFGNKEPIVKHYESMKKWIDYIRNKYVTDNIMPKDTYGDWCMPPESPELIHSQDPARKTDAAVLGTTFYYRILSLLEHFASLQGKTGDAQAFANEAAAVKEAYNKKFFNAETAQYSNNTVTANLLSLCYGMTPEGTEDKVFANIVNKTENDFNSHVSTGLVGIQWLMRGLSEHGRADLAYKIATNRDYPSWGYMIENDATTIWELWNGNTADPGMNSHNHVMLLGDLIVWYYEYLAGIQNTAGSYGFKHITMKPYPVDGLDYVTASYRSIRGEIKSAWKKQDGHFLWDITIPANTTATVYIPASKGKQVNESGQKASSAKGVKFVKTEGDYVVYEVGSGTYSFSAM
ncbi:alpha-rhamnosidase [Bacteroidia bacterium]|nr:alpha-rhamnosidase [Bacteroidia bacterium]